MWHIQVYWFDLVVYLAIYVIGAICFGRFEDWKPRWRRVLKVVLVTAVFVSLLQIGGRPWAWGLIGLMLCAAAYVHLVWLPQHGINGWTAEPREEYLRLVARHRK
jgi:predicted MFS family arabinose efflux permease